MYNKNQITLIGEMLQNASMTELKDGSMVARFNVLTDKFRVNTTNASENIKMVFAWGGVARFISEFCSKGNRLMVTGRLITRTVLDSSGFFKTIEELEIRQLVKL